jgi:hypothetical protein
MSAKLGDFARVRTAKRRLAGTLIQTIYVKESQSFRLRTESTLPSSSHFLRDH